MPFSSRLKATLIRMVGFAKAFDGIEVAPCTMACLAKMRTAVTNAMGPISGMRSPEIVFVAAADGDDMDPYTQVASLRLTTMRRLLAWHPNLRPEAE